MAENIYTLPNLQLRGLMAIRAADNDYARQLAIFQQMHQAFLLLKENYPQVDTLSLGMTHDMTEAIHAGSTLVRIGTTIFGS